MKQKFILVPILCAIVCLYAAIQSHAGEVTFEQIKTNSMIFKATGEGIYPDDASMNQTMKQKVAKRLATLDAYRILAEQIHGIKIKAETNIKDFMLANDEVKTKVSATINGAIIKDVRYKSDIAEVDVEIRLDREFYDSIFLQLK